MLFPLQYYAISNFNIINIELISKFTYTCLLHKLVFLSTSSAYIFILEQDERHMHRFWSKQKKIFEYILHASFVTNFRWLISKERIYVNVIHCVRLYLNEQTHKSLLHNTSIYFLWLLGIYWSCISIVIFHCITCLNYNAYIFFILNFYRKD